MGVLLENDDVGPGAVAAPYEVQLDGDASSPPEPRDRPVFIIRGEGTANERFGLDERGRFPSDG